MSGHVDTFGPTLNLLRAQTQTRPATMVLVEKSLVSLEAC